MTAAQMKPSKKHEISHRGKAMRMMLEELKKRLTCKGKIVGKIVL